MMNSLTSPYTAVVLGASGALGQALAAHLQADGRCGKVLCLSRNSTPGFQLENEASMARCATWLRPHGPLHLVLDATGALTLDGQGPEKRLDDVDGAQLARAMQVNAIGPTLLLKHLTPLLATDTRVIWGKLSARVGSIEDNHKGGWYSYRAAKAALNMLLQTTAIEIDRRRPLAVVAALQPGTVQSQLSAPFVGSHALDPMTSAAGLLKALDGLHPTGRAQFVDMQGSQIPW